MESTVRSGEGGELQRRAAVPPYWDPFGILRSLAGWWDPLGALRSWTPAHTFAPAFDGRDTKDAYILEADLPGIQENELEMSVSGTQLSVSGKRESGPPEETGKYFCSERTYGTFIRTFTLPDDAELDQANVEFRNGVLRVEIPKRTEEIPKPTEAQGRRLGATGAQSGGKGGQRQPTRAQPRAAHPRPRRRPKPAR
jgi:HSP20 family protein